MTWTVTSRGTDAGTLSGNEDMAVAAFTPAAECLLLVALVRTQEDGIASISGHGTWVSVATVEGVYDTNNAIELWACLTSATPGNEAVTVSFGSTGIYRRLMEVIEVDETNGFDATLLNNFGNDVTSSSGPPNTANFNVTATVAAFSQSTNLAFGIVGTDATSANHINPGTGFTQLTENNDGVTSGWTLFTEYQSGEDTTIDAEITISSVNVGIMGIEIKHAAASGGIIPRIMAAIRRRRR